MRRREIVLQDGIRVHADKIREAGGVDAHVQGVGLAAVFLADQRQRDLVAPALVNGLLPLAGNAPVDGPLDPVQVKGLRQHPDGVAGGAVVHHDDLIGPIIQRQQRPHRIRRGDLLVVGGNDDAHGQLIVRRQKNLQLLPPGVLIKLRRACEHGDEQKGGIAQQIEHKKPAHDLQKKLYAVVHAASSLLSAASSRSGSASSSSVS